MKPISFRALTYRRTWLTVGFAWAAIICTASLIPLDHLPIKVNVWDKLEHFTAYSTLALWFGMIVDARKSGYVVAVGAMALGMIIEILQGCTSYRTFDWFDMIANSLGAFTGIVVAFSALGKTLTVVDDKLAALHYRHKT